MIYVSIYLLARYVRERTGCFSFPARSLIYSTWFSYCAFKCFIYLLLLFPSNYLYNGAKYLSLFLSSSAEWTKADKSVRRENRGGWSRAKVLELPFPFAHLILNISFSPWKEEAEITHPEPNYDSRSIFLSCAVSRVSSRRAGPRCTAMQF